MPVGLSGWSGSRRAAWREGCACCSVACAAQPPCTIAGCARKYRHFLTHVAPPGTVPTVRAPPSVGHGSVCMYWLCQFVARLPGVHCQAGSPPTDGRYDDQVGNITFITLMVHPGPLLPCSPPLPRYLATSRAPAWSRPHVLPCAAGLLAQPLWPAALSCHCVILAKDCEYTVCYGANWSRWTSPDQTGGQAHQREWPPVPP